MCFSRWPMFSQSNRHECFSSCIRRLKTFKSMELRSRSHKKVSPLNFEDLIDVKELLDIFY